MCMGLFGHQSGWHRCCSRSSLLAKIKMRFQLKKWLIEERLLYLERVSLEIVSLVSLKVPDEPPHSFILKLLM